MVTSLETSSKTTAASNRKSETLERILGAARAEFTEKGFAAARMENVARAAKVTKQLVHHYFHTKDELYRVVFDGQSEAVIRLLDQATCDGSLPPADAIRRLVGLIVDLHLENPGVTTFTLDQGLQAEHINTQSGFVPLTRQFIDRVIGPLLQRGAESGDFRSGLDPTLFFATVFHIASGCFLMGPAMKRTIGVDFSTIQGVALWRAHATDMILASLRK